jgi:hypothetical protein
MTTIDIAINDAQKITDIGLGSMTQVHVFCTDSAL